MRAAPRAASAWLSNRRPLSPLPLRTQRISGGSWLMRRLRTRTQFQALLRTPPVARTAHFALHRICLTATDEAPNANGGVFLPVGPAWLGAMTPKRSARRAVTRNAMRRQVYAVGDQLDPPLEGLAYLVRLRAPYSAAQFPSARSDVLCRTVRAELMQLFERGRSACAQR
jgi:ribonuclease P protein component